MLMRDGKMLESLGVPLGEGTNNEGELMAVLTGMAVSREYLSEGEELLVVSDSQYVIRGLEHIKDYVKGNRPNKALWILLYTMMDQLSDKNVIVKTHWIKGHSKNNGNIACDRLARKTARTQMHQMIDGKK